MKNTDLGRLLGKLWLPKSGRHIKSKNSVNVSESQSGQFSWAGPAGPLSSESRKNQAESRMVVTVGCTPQPKLQYSKEMFSFEQ
jgi:hypothetical protein